MAPLRSPVSVARASKRSWVKEDANMANLNIKLVKSLNGRLEKQIATAHSLGLRKIGDITVQPDNDQTRGKIAKIGYLLQITEEGVEPPIRRALTSNTGITFSRACVNASSPFCPDFSSTSLNASYTIF